MIPEVQLKRWRLILGQDAEDKLAESQNQRQGNGGNGSAGGNGGGNGDSGDGKSLLSREESAMDRALAAIYDDSSGASGKGADLGPSYPNVARWLTDIRAFFPKDVVSVMQADAIKNKGLSQLLFEPETIGLITPDINMVATLLSLKDMVPEASKEQARVLVKALVNEIMKQMEHELRQVVSRALNRKRHSPLPSLPNMDWKRTIEKNLKNYDRAKKRIIPEKFYFFESHRLNKDWTIILDMDQSGSMADSIIYASIMGSIFASIPALNTRIVAFDTEVIDLTETCGSDPVDILFGVQLGGGTDINKSVQYCATFVEDPRRTLFILISDLYEGGDEAGLLRRLAELKDSGVIVLVLLALSDQGIPSYDADMAAKISACGNGVSGGNSVSESIPCFGCTPQKLPELIGGALRGDDLHALAARLRIGGKE
jgi:hypothetical protein